jgi:8-oxo-dGTP pyrophosphatase MutT (NUDIX family)
MVRAWHFIGRVAFWLSWPLLFLYLRRTERTRIVVLCGHEVLVVRRWLGGGWSLPGGGLHPGESPENGAIRELREETGVEVNATDLQKLYSKRARTEHSLRYRAHVFGLRLKQKPQVARQRFELTHVEWMNTDKLLSDGHIAPDVREAIVAFCNR